MKFLLNVKLSCQFWFLSRSMLLDNRLDIRQRKQHIDSTICDSCIATFVLFKIFVICPFQSALWTEKFPLFPTGIPFVYRPRWTGIRFKTQWTVWCCCHVFQFLTLENLHWCLQSTLRSQTAATPTRRLSSPPVHACLRELKFQFEWQETFETIWKLWIVCHWILVIEATLLQIN